MSKEELIKFLKKESESNHKICSEYYWNNSPHWEFYQGRVDAFELILEKLEKSPENF